jgi:hypothetical protein
LARAVPYHEAHRAALEKVRHLLRRKPQESARIHESFAGQEASNFV